MHTKEDLKEWVVNVLRTYSGGQASLIDVARYIWAEHEADLRASGDLFYKWQYDMRWAALSLRHEGRLVPSDDAPRGYWKLAR